MERLFLLLIFRKELTGLGLKKAKDCIDAEEFEIAQINTQEKARELSAYFASNNIEATILWES